MKIVKSAGESAEERTGSLEVRIINLELLGTLESLELESSLGARWYNGTTMQRYNGVMEAVILTVQDRKIRLT